MKITKAKQKILNILDYFLIISFAILLMFLIPLIFIKGGFKNVYNELWKGDLYLKVKK